MKPALDKGGERRREILHHATSLFNERGYFDTRLEDVAAELGATKTSISYHFRSKEALLFAAYDEACTIAEQALDQAAAAPTGLARVQAWLREVAHLHVAAMRGTTGALAMTRDPAALAQADQEVIDRRLRAQGERLGAFVRQGQADGTIAGDYGANARFFLLSIPLWLGRWLSDVDASRREGAVDGLLDLVANGLATRRRLFRSPSPRMASLAEDYLFDRDARKQLKLDAFLRVATRHFNRSGYRTLSLNDVSSELGVTRGSLYYHFADKDELLDGCVHRSLGLMEEALERGAREADGLARLHAALSLLFDGHVSGMDPLLRFSLLPSLPAKRVPIAAARLKSVMAGIGNHVATGMGDGSIRPLGVDGLDHLAMGALTSATQGWWQRLGMPEQEGEEGHGLVAADYFAPLVHGLAPRA